MSWRYRPTPESSDGAGDARSLFAAAAGIRAPLVCDRFLVRVRVEVGVVVPTERVLPSHAGRAAVLLVTVDLADTCPSSECPGRREVGVAWVRRLAGRICG